MLDELEKSPDPGVVRSWPSVFEVLPARVELEIAQVIDTPETTHIHYRVRR